MPKRVTKKVAEPEKRFPIPDEKWFTKRMDSLGLTNASVAPEFGLGPNKIWMMKAGKRAVRPDEALIWARLLNVLPSEIFERLGYKWPDLTVPVVGRLKPDGRVTRIDPAQGLTAPMPVTRGGTIVALVVEKPIRSYGVRIGAHLYYEPRNDVHVSAHGRLSVLGLGDHPEPIVGILESAALGQARVVVWGTSEVIHSEQTISAAPVLWIRAG